MTFKKLLVTERQKAVIETIRMNLSEVNALAYLKGVGFEMSDTTWYREKKRVEKMKLKRLYHIAQIGFQDQHLERIDMISMGFDMMWKNVLRQKDPYKANLMIRDILMLQPYLSSYYEATKDIIVKQPEYQNEIQSRQESNSVSESAGTEEESREISTTDNIRPNNNRKF